MSAIISWSVGLLAAVVLFSPLASALVPSQQDDPQQRQEQEPSSGHTMPLSDPGAPEPVWSSTLPGPFGAGETIYYEDFGWCKKEWCNIRESDYMLAEGSNARVSVSGKDVWLVGHQNETTGQGELQYLSEGFGKHYFELAIEPEAGIQGTGQNLAVSYLARGPADAQGLEGGLRLQMKFWEGATDMLDCMMVPSTGIDGVYQQHVALNPLCNMIPVANEIVLVFTVEEGLLSSPGPGDVAIESILVEEW